MAASTSFSFSVILDIFQQKNYRYGYFLSKRNTQTGGKMLPFPTYTHILLNIQWASILETVHSLFKINLWYSDALLHENIEKFNEVQN